MHCDEYLPLIGGHLDGTNKEAEERRLQEHLQTCEACRALLSQMEQNDALLRDAAAEPPVDLTERIMREVRREKQTVSRKKRWIPIAASGIAAAALLSLVVWGNLPIGNNAKDSAAETVAEAAVNEKDEQLAEVTTAAAPQEPTFTYYGELNAPEEADGATGLYTPKRFLFASQVPTLIVWNAGKPDALANCAPEALPQAAPSTANGSATLYSHILDAIPLNDTDYNVMVYSVPYDTMIEIFSECATVYENAVYYPAADPTSGDCNVVLINGGN